MNDLVLDPTGNTLKTTGSTHSVYTYGENGYPATRVQNSDTSSDITYTYSYY